MNEDQKKTREFLHSWYLLIMVCFSLLFVLVNSNYIYSLVIYTLVYFFYFKNGLEFKKYLKILLFCFLFGSSVAFFTIALPSSNLKNEVMCQIGNFTIFKAAVDKAAVIMIRLILVASLSMGAASVIKITKIILYLMIHKLLKVILGYPLLIALNSISLFQSELERIKVVAAQRNLPLKDRLIAFFPLIIFAIRHSQRGALSLVTRGLSENKGFFFRYDLSLRDRFFLLFFFFVYFILILLLYSF